MKYITLKNSELLVSRVALGGCPLGGYGWGEVDDGELNAAIDASLDCGVNFFDTADVYGLGKSEEILGSALKKCRSDVVIATKFGVRRLNGQSFYDNSPGWIEEAAVQSLRRLQTDYIDLYQVHYRDETPAEYVIEALENLQKKGYIRYFGVSNIAKRDGADLDAFAGRTVSFQEEYSLAQRKNEDVIRQLRKRLHATPLTWGSLGQGILSGKYDENSVFSQNDRRNRDVYVNFHGEKLKANMRIVKVLKEIAAYFNWPVPALAIGFILSYIEDSVALAGAKNASQAKTNAFAADISLAGEQIEKLLHVSEGTEDE